MIWGAAYISVCTSYAQVPFLVLVFAVEKFFFTAAWLALRARQGKAHQIPTTQPMVA
jgi:hypothetical protein